MISATDKIPLSQKIAFSLGGTMDFFATGLTVSVLWMPYFNIGLGLSPVLLGLIMMAFQIWNALIDPVMGNLSDNTRTRWGRRRPFMFVGSILTAAIFPLLWFPPIQHGTTAVAIYLLGVGFLFFLSFSCWAMAYYGLQLELTPSYDERTRLAAWSTLFQKLTSLIAGWVMALLTCAWFADPLSGKPDIVHGMRVCWIFFAVGIIVTGLLPAIFVRERYYEADASHQSRDRFWTSIRESIGCGPLRTLIGVAFLVYAGTVTASNVGSYLGLYWVMGGDLAKASVIGGWKTTVLVVTGIASIPLWTWLGEKYDKKVVVGAMLLVAMGGHLLNIWCMRPGWPWLQLIPGLTESAAIAAVWLFVPSMKADIADYDELHTGRRREGSLNSVFSVAMKSAMAFGAGAGGIVLELSGFRIEKLAQQPEKVFWYMRLIYITLPLLIWLAALYFVCRFTLNRRLLLDIRKTLETRRTIG